MSNILFQLPATFRYSEENLRLVLRVVPNEESMVVEFRDASWWNEPVRAALRAANITFCNVNYPGLDAPFMHTSRVFYLRMHGTPRLFKSRYSIEVLKQVARDIPRSAELIYIYFNNTMFDAGYTNASEFMEIVSVTKQKLRMAKNRTPDHQ